MRIIDVQTGRKITPKLWDGAKWVPARGFGDEKTRTVTPPTGPVKNIAGGGAFMNLPVTSADETGSLVAARIPVVVDAVNPVAEFDVLMNDNVARVVELRVAVAVGDDAPAPVTFNGGKPSARVERPGTPGGGIVHVKTDPLPISANAGEVLTWYGFTGAPEGGRPMGDQVGYLPGRDAWYAVGDSFEAAFNGVRMSGGSNAETPDSRSSPRAYPGTDRPTRMGAHG